jgi:tRNA threonylcarbamoyladenosine biosynthesis protein TsaB
MSITPAGHELVLNSNSSASSLTVLGLDTASTTASYAIARNGVLAASLDAADGDRPSETLFRSLSRLLEEACVELSEIDLFCAVVGPGSFTGLRVSLAAVEGIAQTLRLPAIGYDTFDGWALAARRAGTVLAIVAAGRGEVYGGVRTVGVDGNLMRIGDDLVGPPDLVVRQLRERSQGPLILTGDGLGIAGDVLKGVESADLELIRSGSPSLAAAIAQHATMGEQRPLRPYYLRKPDVR